MINIISKVRSCSADRSIDTVCQLYSDRLFSGITGVWINRQQLYNHTTRNLQTKHITYFEYLS